MTETNAVPTRSQGCCGGPAPDDDSCCANDAQARADGQSGCDCGEPDSGCCS